MEQNQNIKVVIADDHEIYRDGLKLMLSKADGIVLAGEAGDGEALVKLVDEILPDVVITDIKMPDLDGVDAARKIVKKHPRIGIIGLSMFEDEQLIMEMLDAGAQGYLLKNSDKSELIDAIHSVYEGEQYFCKHTSSKMAKVIALSRHGYRERHMPIFERREKEIIVLICEGLTNKEIGDRLNISPRTVEGIRMRILVKLHVKNTVGIVIAAIKYGLYAPA
jgi:DNA-binding NarL/FixJ family response regulator